ncbi:uncharacterized protein LOC144715156 [Wolffia australiana]
MSSPRGGTKKKTRKSSLFSLTCGCRSERAVSVATNPGRRLYPSRPETSSDDATTPTTTTSHGAGDEDDDVTLPTPSYSGLLRQLDELERSVASWVPSSAKPKIKEDDEMKPKPAMATPPSRHRRCFSEGGRVEGFVAVVKQTEDPLGDFRRSMLQMIVEKEILGGEELRDLLLRFLSLNSPAHHKLIVQAFSDIWGEVFSGDGDEDLGQRQGKWRGQTGRDLQRPL